MPADVLADLCKRANLDPSTPAPELKQQLLAAFKVSTEAEILQLSHIGKHIDDVDGILDTCYKVAGDWSPVPLSNVHIDQTLDQWEHEFRDFCNVGFTMLDFATYKGMPQQLIDNLDALWLGRPCSFTHTDAGGDKRHKGPPPRRRFSIVVNSDVLGGPGKHWTCIFIDMRNPNDSTIEFFNSSGNKPYPQILDWVEEFRVAALRHCRAITFVPVTAIRHQKGGTECGVYCLNYIDQRLLGISSDAFKHGEVPDEKMTELRKRLFRA